MTFDLSGGILMDSLIKSLEKEGYDGYIDETYRIEEERLFKALYRIGDKLPPEWLQVAGGLEHNKILREKTKKYGISVTGLVIEQLKPFEVAHGRTHSTFHSASRRKKSDPKVRILSRSFRVTEDLPTAV